MAKLNNYERKIRKLEKAIKKSGIHVTINDDINMSEISDMTSVEGGTEIEDNSMVSNENITRTISTRNIREGNIGNHDKKESEAQLRPAQKEKVTKALEVELVPSANLEATRTNGKTVTDGYDESGDESNQEEQCYVDHEDIQNLMNFEKYDKM